MRARAAGQVEGPLSSEQLSAAERGAKGLIPLAGRPLLDYVLHELAEGGVTNVVFVVAPGDEAIQDRYLNTGIARRLTVRIAIQQQPRGTADALYAARTSVNEGEFLMLNSDNLYPAESISALLSLNGPGLIGYDAESLVGKSNISREKVLNFALLDVTPDNILRSIVEKPAADHPLAQSSGRLVSMNLWRFDSGIFDDCAAVKPSMRGELELVDAVRNAISVRGVNFKVVRQQLGVLDLSSRSDIASAESLLAGRRVQL